MIDGLNEGWIDKYFVGCCDIWSDDVVIVVEGRDIDETRLSILRYQIIVF